MKKYAFFKYFIKNKVFMGGRSRETRPHWVGIGCSIFIPDIVWGRGRRRVHGNGGGDTQTRPRSAPLPYLVIPTIFDGFF